MIKAGWVVGKLSVGDILLARLCFTQGVYIKFLKFSNDDKKNKNGLLSIF
jgi:hypothetical protein